MAFLRYASALVVRPVATQRAWSRVRTAGRVAVNPTASLVNQASEILGRPFSPENYLLTHCTIVASVDVEEVRGVKTGSIVENGRKINRKYLDYRVTADTDKYINNNCFPPGTPVLMADGTSKAIEDIEVGEEVITHRGRVRKVVRTYENPHEGDLVQIKFRGNNERVYVTDEHPLFVFRPLDGCIECGAPFRHRHRAISHLLNKFYCSTSCYFRRGESKADLLSRKEGNFVPAGEVRDHLDFVSTPVVSEVRPVDLSPNRARLIGYFLAEGWYESRTHESGRRIGVSWALHRNEEDTLARNIVELMHTEFGVECKIHLAHGCENGIKVTTSLAPEAVDFFQRWVHGDGAKSKTLDRDIIYAPHNIQMEVLRGWFEGDGSSFDTRNETRVGDIRMAGSTASPRLASQLRLMLHRVGVSPQWAHAVAEGRRRLVIDGKQRIMSDPAKECHSWMLSCGGSWISGLVENTYYESAYQKALDVRGGPLQAAPSQRFLNGYVLQMIESVDRVEYTGKVHNIEVEEDNSYVAAGIAVHNCDAFSREVLLKAYRTFIGAQNYLEHVQVEDLSKGRIIDAVARDIGDSIYVDILVATDRRHKELVADIESGKLTTLSMGCSVVETVCTKCGNVAVDETDLCDCIKYAKGNVFLDERGKRHRIAELCGHPSLDETGGVTFIEGSWVASPAFTGAVMRNIIAPSQLDPKVASRIQEVLNTPPPQWVSSDLGMAKAATTAIEVEAQEPKVVGKLAGKPRWNTNAAFDFGDEDEGEDDAPAQTPFEQLEDRVLQNVIDRVERRVRDELSKRDKEKEPKPEESSSWQNKTIHEARRVARQSYAAAVSALIRTASTDGDLLNKVAILDESFGLKVPVEVYRTTLKVGGISQHRSLKGFLTACRGTLGRPMSRFEAQTFIRLGRILSTAEANLRFSTPETNRSER